MTVTSPDAAKTDQITDISPAYREPGAAADLEVEDEGAGVVLMVLDPDPVADPDGAPVAATVDAGRLASTVKDAVRPVAFLQVDGGAVALPATKLTAAHCVHSWVSPYYFSGVQNVRERV